VGDVEMLVMCGDEGELQSRCCSSIYAIHGICSSLPRAVYQGPPGQPGDEPSSSADSRFVVPCIIRLHRNGASFFCPGVRRS
jgi:hypothetical protein